MQRFKILAYILIIAFSTETAAVDVVSTRTLTHTLAVELASSAVNICEGLGYQVSAVVVDRNAITQVVIRSSLAPRFTIQIAEEKANATIMAGIKSGELVKNRQDIRQELNHVDGLLMLRGAIPVTAGGNLLGAIGVSGAPGGDNDELCAQKALEKFAERLEFAD
ncbi:MAG: heme-binding protein [Gammaproteobacteria bacterium]|nr:heme-binding protein [Gammaproteobacteria bacterium]